MHAHNTLSRATVTFPACVRQFRLVLWRAGAPVRRCAIIKPARDGAKLFRWRLARARRQFLNLLTFRALLSACAVIR